MKIEELCRKHGISNATYYNWKSKYGGMEASDIKRLRELEEENSRLKKMFAELSLEKEAMKELFKKRFGNGERREAAQFFKDTGLSIVKACELQACLELAFTENRKTGVRLMPM